MKNSNQEIGLDETQIQRYESQAYYECDRCGFRVRESIDGRIDLPNDDEWNQFSE
jgi:hypothetical protein